MAKKTAIRKPTSTTAARRDVVKVRLLHRSFLRDAAGDIGDVVEVSPALAEKWVAEKAAEYVH